MYAIIEDRGRQYQAEAGKRFEIDHLDAEPGATVEVPVVMFCADGAAPEIGAPRVPGRKAVLKVVQQGLGPKVVIGVFKRRKNQNRRKGFRAMRTTVEVVSIG